jgi:NarL family two-component system response regulator LiaR
MEPEVQSGAVPKPKVTDPLRVIIADDDALARRVLRDALQGAGVIVIAEAADGREAVELAAHYVPDVVVMDVVMPGVDGLEATRRIADRVPGVKVVMLTSTDDVDVGLVGLRAGAVGYLSKSLPPESLPQALRAARDGEAVVSRRMTTALVESVRRLREDGAGLRPVRSPLTPREWEVLDLLCDGLSTDGIADRLYLSDETVRSHVKKILRKLGVRSRQEAVESARRLRHDLMSEGGGDAPHTGAG